MANDIWRYGDLTSDLLRLFVLVFYYRCAEVSKDDIFFPGCHRCPSGGVTTIPGEETMQGAQLTGPGQEMTLNAEQVKKVHEMMVQLLESENLMNEVTVRVEERGIVISIIDGLLFQSGSVELIPPARRLIYKIAQIINDLPNQISVEGHTDNVPLNRGPYRDNWGLSAMRAAVVGSYLVEAGIDPKRLRTVGYGQSRPLVPNDTEEHRRINRRVDIVILNNFKE